MLGLDIQPFETGSLGLFNESGQVDVELAGGNLHRHFPKRYILVVSTLALHDDHRDPFDRLLVAQSLSEPLVLLTADAKLARYGTTVRVV